MATGSGKTKTAQALTDKAIKAMKPGSEPYRVPDMRCKGLALRVAADGGIFPTGSRAKASGGLLWAVMRMSGLRRLAIALMS
jgi:hypothetical protein